MSAKWTVQRADLDRRDDQQALQGDIGRRLLFEQVGEVTPAPPGQLLDRLTAEECAEHRFDIEETMLVAVFARMPDDQCGASVEVGHDPFLHLRK